MSDPIARLNAALEGRYTIERELGEGGMATVYLADDLKHERKVALKVLKPELAAVVGAERFLAEIKTTASLQHPHILPLFDSGEADSLVWYVMPYVKGESLRDKLERERQLPVDEAVRITTNVAEALDYAHAQGVIHRDIKPANILLQAGKPVISDFGIALAVGVGGGGRLTETGLSLGTPHYMSPEQATGDQMVGRATDIYALGAVLYEMLVGSPPFVGGTAQAVLGQIIAGTLTSPSEQRASVPANVDAAIQKALEKVPADRFAGAQDFMKALADTGFRHGEVAAVGGPLASGRWSGLTMLLAATTLISGGVAAWQLLRTEPPPLVARFSSPFEDGQSPLGSMDLTADGSTLVYVGPGEFGGAPQVWVRRWDDLEATPIRGTEQAGTVALSPDGLEVAFAGFPGPLRAVPLDGGPVRTLADRVINVWDWTPDGSVFVSQASTGVVIARIPATGGGAEALETLTEIREGEVAHIFYTGLPGGRTGVFQVIPSESIEDAEVWAIDLDTRERVFLTVGHSPRYATTGHLLFGTVDGALMAAPIDPATGELTGPSIPVVESLAVSAAGDVTYAVSESGTLIYGGGSAGVGLRAVELVWITRSGDVAPVDPELPVGMAGGNFGLSLSPDGMRLALATTVDGNTDIWIKHLPVGPLERLTFDDATEAGPFWSPDGEFVSYGRSESRPSNFDAWRRRADGTGSPEPLLDDSRSFFQGRWSPDGEWMVFRSGNTPGRDILGFRPGMDTVAVPLVANAGFEEQDPALSSDGRWLAYTSDRTGRPEVYVSPFPNVDSRRVPVSTAGGFAPRWAHNGRELFFVNDGALVAAVYETEPEFRVLQRETLFPLPTGGPMLEGFDFYQVAPDDQRFLMPSLRADAASGAEYILVQNFFEELKELAGN